MSRAITRVCLSVLSVVLIGTACSGGNDPELAEAPAPAAAEDQTSAVSSEVDFCDAWTTATGEVQRLLTTDSGELPGVVDDVRAALAPVADAAPSSLAPDVVIVETVVDGATNALEEAGFDRAQVDADDRRALATSSSEFTAAVERVSSDCGVEVGLEAATVNQLEAGEAEVAADDGSYQSALMNSLSVDSSTADCLAETLIEMEGDPAALERFADPNEEICGLTLRQLSGITG